ncbi:hypothetical protein L2E82_30784 [Cichorium intybus]|uniref:Uncharacterized protein n=1 Tax=Cichorium intybus TaxID=13427 RepID=A0ACB9D1G9_CICIN|nr:hypothetical protein L2E82_30784 [Cichorium intybus]
MDLQFAFMVSTIRTTTPASDEEHLKKNIIRSECQSNAYIIDMNHNTPENVTCLFSKASERNAMLWHRRLGHANANNMNRLAKNDLVQGLLIKDFITFEKCVSCSQATPKFNSKADDCYFFGYARKTVYWVYNKVTKQIVESYDVRWLEENETDARVGPDWLFNYADLFKPFYVLFGGVSGTQPRSSGVNRDDDAEIILDLITPSVILEDPALNDGASPTSNIVTEDAPVDSSHVVGEPPAVDQSASLEDALNSDPADLFDSTLMDFLFPERIPDEYVASTSHDFRDSDRGALGSGSVENITNLLISTASLEHAVPSRIQRDHPIDNVICSLNDWVQTRSQSGSVNECLYSCFISQIEPKNFQMELNEPSWVDVMHEELNQFQNLNVWQLVKDLIILKFGTWLTYRPTSRLIPGYR